MFVWREYIEVVIKNVTTRTSSKAIYTLCLSYEYSYPLHGYVTYTGIRYIARNVLDVLPCTIEHYLLSITIGICCHLVL